MRKAIIYLAVLAANSFTQPVDAVRQSLEGASERWFHWLVASSGVVVLGCIMEIGETWTDLKRWARLRRSIAVEEENQKSWLIPIGAVGLLLVTSVITQNRP